MSSTYPPGFQPKTIAEQTKVLTKYFKKLKVPEDYSAEKYEGEAFYLIPHWKTLGTYHEACEKVIGLLKDSRDTYSYLTISPARLRQTEKKAAMWNQAENVLIIPCQLGQKHAGKSPESARGDFSENEIGLGVYEAAIIALTHPERFQTYSELDMDLVGDEYDYPVGDVRFARCPALFFDGRLEFVYRWIVKPDERFGAASAFVSVAPQVKLELRPLDPIDPLDLTLENAIRVCKEAGLTITKTY